MTLQRVMEAEVMDSMEEAMAYDDMDHSEANQSFVTDFLAAGELNGLVLDLGTGTAQIPVELCERHEDCYVMAVDASVYMLDVARYTIEIAGLIERIQLGHVDAKQLPHEDGMFNAVINNGMLHHIPDPTTVLSEMLRVTAPGGRVFVRDLLRPEDEDSLQALVDAYASEADERQRKMFADSLHAAFTLEEIRQAVGSLGCNPESVQVTSDRHWTWSMVKDAAE